MTISFKFLNCSLAVLATASLTLGQENETAGDSRDNAPSAREVQTALKEWVQTKQLISRERATWTTEQETLFDLSEVRQREIEQLGEFTQAAGDRIEKIDELRKQYADEENSLKEWRRDLERHISTLEAKLRPLIPLFPMTLRAKVEEAVVRLETPDPERSLQHRTRDVLLVMQAYLNFQNTITLDADIRSIDGEDREVEILYLGLTQAWYVDQTGKYSGYGVPGSTGWIWSEEPAIATAVRQTIAIQTRQATPAFVTLPLLNSGVGAQPEAAPATK